MFSGHIASFKIRVLKVQDFGTFELSPMQLTLTLFILMKFAMHVDRISMEMPIWYLIINISYPSFQENWSCTLIINQ